MEGVKALGRCLTMTIVSVLRKGVHATTLPRDRKQSAHARTSSGLASATGRQVQVPVSRRAASEAMAVPGGKSEELPPGTQRHTHSNLGPVGVSTQEGRPERRPLGAP